MGIVSCWGLNYVVQFIRKDVVTNSNYMAVVRVSLKWAAAVLKIFVLGAIWLTVPPLLLGTAQYGTAQYVPCSPVDEI